MGVVLIWKSRTAKTLPFSVVFSVGNRSAVGKVGPFVDVVGIIGFLSLWSL